MKLPTLQLPTETWSCERARELGREQRDQQYRRTDQLFLRLLAVEYVACILAAAWISPYAWVGHEWEVHPHVWSATLLGGLIVSLPMGLAWWRPGQSLTRQVIAVAQMMMSALMIHLSQGRIEAHFHVFGSLAFLAFYRDWRVLITASAVTAVDHLVRGYAWPLSIYGVDLYSPWRWLEHTAWVVFEDVFLILACLQSNRETNTIAERQSESEQAHDVLDQRVKERTADLENANVALQAEIDERLRAESALRLSEFSVANASLPTFWIARDSHIVRVNRAVSDLLGYSEAELLQLSITDLDPDFNKERWPAHWEELRQKKRMCFETRQCHKSGHLIPIEVELNWFEFEGHEYNFAFVRDIRERQVAEERFRLVVEAAPSAIVVVNQKREITLVNGQTEQLFGYHRDELLGMLIETLVPERFRPQHPSYVQGFFREPQARSIGPYRNLFGRKKSGGEFPIELGLSPFVTREGTLVLASVTDITSRKQADEELRSAKEAAEAANRVLDSSLKSIADGVIVADSQGKFLFWNQVAEEIIGLGATDTPIAGWTERYGCFLPDMVTPFPPQDLPLSRTIRGEMIHEVDLFIRNPKKPDGVWISVNGRPLLDDTEAIRGGVVVFRDTTEQRQVQQTLARQAEELARSNKELEQFAYIASHDLQEPLRKVQTFGDLIASDSGSSLSADGLDYLQRMRNAASRMQTFINDLLTYSRVSSQAKPFELVPLNQIAREVLSDLEVRILSTGGRVDVGELPTLDADPVQMRQLLQNLIGNALKFHRPGVPPVVLVQSRFLDSKPGTVSGQLPSRVWCEITVRDNGIGFEEKYVDRIFAPFKRLHGRGEYEGTGIGLAICHKIVERHGGTITARSVPDEGTQMIVTLPRDQTPEAPHHA